MMTDGDDQSSTSKTELADTRTELAEDRTALANERTYAGWFRTGLAAIALGIAFNVLFRTMEPPWIPRAISTAFLVIAIIIFIAADRRARAVIERLSAHEVKELKPIKVRLLTGLAVTADVALIVAVWALPPGD